MQHRSPARITQRVLMSPTKATGVTVLLITLVETVLIKLFHATPAHVLTVVCVQISIAISLHRLIAHVLITLMGSSVRNILVSLLRITFMRLLLLCIVAMSSNPFIFYGLELSL